MKTIKIILTAIVIVLTYCSLPAQAPPPPNGGNTPTEGGNTPVGGSSAPISGGLFVLLGAGVAYGLKKMYDLRQESLEE